MATPWTYRDAAAMARARAEVDAEIASMERSIMGLKTRRNTLASISRLPEEMLRQIFLECCDYDIRRVLQAMDEGSHISGATDYLARLLPVSQVSRHWRAVLHNFPKLWTLIDCLHPSVAKELFQRSEISPLSVVLDYSRARHLNYPREDLLGLFLPHLHRIRRLALLAVPHPVAQHFSRELTAVAGSLEFLQWNCYASPTSPAYHLPDGLFGGAAARIRYATIKGGLKWESASFLTHVKKLHVITRGDGHRMSSLSSMLAALQDMRELEILVLDHAIGNLDQPVRIPSVTLVRLANLAITDERERLIASFVQAVVAPNLSRVSLYYSQEIPASLPPLTRFLASFWGGLDKDGQRRGHKICLDEETRLQGLPMWVLQSRDLDDDHKAAPPLTFAFRAHPTERDAIIQAVCSHIYSPQTMLDTECALRWDAVNACFAGVCSLAIRGSTGWASIENLVDQELHGAAALLPRLRTVIFMDTEYDHDRIEEWLRFRRATGCAIGEIVFSGVDRVSPEEIDVLRLLVKDVQWILPGSPPDSEEE